MKNIHLLILSVFFSGSVCAMSPKDQEIDNVKKNLAHWVVENNQLQISQCENQLVEYAVRFKIGNPMDHARNALKAAEKTGDKGFEAYTAMSLTEKMMGDSPEDANLLAALFFANQSLAAAQKCEEENTWDPKKITAGVEAVLGGIHFALNNIDEAKKHIGNALLTADRLDSETKKYFHEILKSPEEFIAFLESRKKGNS